MRWWSAAGWLSCGPGGAGRLWCWGSSFAYLGVCSVGVALVVVEGVYAVGGWRCCSDADIGGAGDVVGEGAVGGAPGVGAAGDVDGEGVVGDALVDGGALMVPSGSGLATPGGGSRWCCWPVRRPWRCWPRLVSR